MLKTTLILSYIMLFNTILSPLAFASENYKNYVFPLKKSNGRITGSFAEQRGLRFHAGIDFSTGNQTGLPVLSIDDAVVERIKTSYAGYGKAVYLKLSDGNIAVYAHLKDFAPKIKDVLKTLQKEKKSFWIDAYVSDKNIQIQKGEVIGLSGASGGSSAHLHFETRDSAQKPFNLLNKPNIENSSFFKEINELNKEASPLIKKIFLIPLDNNSFINGSNSPQSLTPYKKDTGSYYIKEPISLYGKIAIAVHTYEDVAGNKIGPKSISLNINNNNIYSVNLNDFSYSQYNYSGLIYNLKLSQAGFKNTFLLSKTIDNTLTFTQNHKKNDGLINTYNFDSTQPIKAVITVINSTGTKKSETFLTFNKIAPQIIKNTKYFLNGNNKLNLSIDTSALTDTVSIEIATLYNKESNDWKTLKNISLDKNQQEINFSHQFEKEPFLIKLAAKDIKGSMHAPLILRPKDYTQKAKNELIIQQHNGLIGINIITDTPPFKHPKALIKTNDTETTVNLMPITPYLYSADIFTKNLFNDTTNMEIQVITEPDTDKEEILSENLKLYYIEPDNDYLINSKDQNCYVKISKNNLFNRTYISTATLNKDFITKHIPKNTKLIPASLAYRITPEDLLLKQKIKIGIKAEKDNFEQSGIFYLLKDKWVFDGKYDKNDNFIETKTRVNGIYCLLKDIKKPTITNINPIHDKKVYVKIPKISAVIYDKESGLDISKTELTLNGIKCEAEYDKNTDKIFFLPEKLIQGINTATIKTSDNVGNETEKTFTFVFQQENL